jgi:ABC-type antimicrobial peptide transport system permease subunit
MAGPLVKLAGFSRAGVLAVVVAGAIIISLLMTLVTHERKLEIGVLRALGAGRRAVAGQFALETLMVCAVAVVLGLAVGAVVAQTAANVLLAREIAATQGQGMGRSLVMQGVNIFRIPGFGGAGCVWDFAWPADFARGDCGGGGGEFVDGSGGGLVSAKPAP